MITTKITMPTKRILVTGCNGQLGRELQRLGNISPHTYLFTDLAELDITDRQAVHDFVTREKIELVVNCAAYTRVEKAEEEEPLAEEVNAGAVRNLAEAVREVNGTLFHISTDYVFAGDGNIPLTEEMPVHPLNAYGRTKLHGEEAIAAAGCRAIIIRTSWLYSEWGGNFLKTMLRLTAERETLSVVFDQTGTPTYAGDLALAIFSIIESETYAGNEGIYHFSNEGVCSWYDFAVEIAEAAGHNRCRIVPCRSSEYPSKAQRPAYSVLDKSKIKRTFGVEIPHWRDSMRYCIERIMKEQEKA